MIRFVAFAFVVLFDVGAGLAAELPKSTIKAIGELGLAPTALDGLDDELNVPRPWLDGAASEKEVKILGTWDDRQFRAMTVAFRERYPFVKLNYSRAGNSARIMKVVVALREGRVLADVIIDTSTGGALFKRAKALADLRELPAFKNVLGHSAAPDGTYVGYKVVYRCIAYNTKLLKKADLPKTWRELASAPSLQNGKLALSNRPNTWLVNLWGEYGDAWGTAFIRQLFEGAKPQLRKEGMNATLDLTIAGEAGAVIPATNYRVNQLRLRGAPIGYHCPTPITAASAKVVMLEKAQHKNGARLFINWLISREGQVLQHVATSATPIHKALQKREFIAYAEEILGNPVVVLDEEVLTTPGNKKMLTLWNRYWGG